MQAPAVPDETQASPDETLTHLGYKRYSPAGPTALPPTSSVERRRRQANFGMVGTKPDPASIPPAQAPPPPARVQPSTRGRGRAASAPRSSIRQEEVEILLPQPDALTSDLAKVFFKRGPT